MILVKEKEISEKLTGSHVPSVDQLFHIAIQNDAPFLNLLEIADLEECLARQLRDVGIKVPDMFVQRVKLRVPFLELPALVVLGEANNDFVKYNVTLAAVYFLFLEGWDLYHHSLNVIHEFPFLHFLFCLSLDVIV